MNTGFFDWLKINNWTYEKNDKINITDIAIRDRYNNIPEEFIDFLTMFKSITSADETTWFLCNDDYTDDSEDAFRWNEFEIMSIEAAGDDNIWKDEIVKWWTTKLPFILSVNNGYSYYAIDLENSNGTIVRGEEPEFEDTVVVANSFDDFICKLINEELYI
ncbi:MAG: SMI1/KNR4 family protein [Erysipelotrichaceae bacterium]|nr:SMI1/KNR4 family protein [Erysipelotrichaceae bacterium]